MPKYRIQLKQGKRTLVEYGEFKSVDSCLMFYQTLTTMKVTEILKIEYEDITSHIPVDDFNYRSLCKLMIKNNTLRITQQVILHNIKMTKNENEIYMAMLEHMEINGLKVDGVTATLFKTWFFLPYM